MPTTAVLRVPGMDCAAEEQLVRVALAEVPGVRGWGLGFDLAHRRVRRLVIVTGRQWPDLVIGVLIAVLVASAHRLGLALS